MPTTRNFPSVCVLARLLACGLIALGANAGVRAATTPTPVVVTTNTVLADIARQVGGARIEVKCLVQVGTDLHGFEPKPSDVAWLTRAQLVIGNGAGAEPWLDRLIESSGYAGMRIEAIKGCVLIEHHSAADHAHESVDPHAWQDAANGAIYAGNIAAALAQVDPSHAQDYRERGASYAAELRALDASIRDRFSAVSADRRRIITSHDALAYFGRAYGLEILPVRGLEPEQEPDARHFAALVDQLRTQQVRAIFIESVSNPRMLEQLARDTGAILGGEIHTDSVGPAGSPAETYAGMLRENAATILRALARE